MSESKEIRPDILRYKRQGFPEAIYCPGKTTEQIVDMAKLLAKAGGPVILTKLTPDNATTVLKSLPQAKYYPQARMAVINPPQPSFPKGRECFASCRKGGGIGVPLSNISPFSKGGLRGIIAKGKGKVTVITAGTSDIPVAEEAAITAETLNCQVARLYDAGVAGIHRLTSKMKLLRGSSCVVVCAGMEGALPSVVGGLVNCAVIAVPTSVGYGTGAGGFAALLTMLNSCAPNVACVNIDDGFGAGVLASLISKAHCSRRL